MLKKIVRHLSNLKNASSIIRDWRKAYTLRKTDLFDPLWYVRMNPDVKDAGIDPAFHYVRHGATEGREPSPFFSGRDYLSGNPDVASAGLNPLLHYLRHGRFENRKLRMSKLTAFGPRHMDGLSSVSINSNTDRLVEIHANVNKGRKYQEWDVELEQRFLSSIQKEYFLDQDRYDTKLASIIMPTFNRADKIGRAIDSVLKQSHQNWRLIIVDDGSTDDTFDVIKCYLSDERIIYIKQENSGVSAARNAGINAADGDFIFYIDSDNSWYSNHIRSLIVFQENFGLEAAYCAIKCVDDHGDIKFYRGAEFLWEACLDSNYIDLNCFSHRNFKDRKYYFDSSLRRLVDWDFILNITKGHRTAYAPFLGVEYYDGSHGERITLTRHVSGDLNTLISSIQQRHKQSDDQLLAIRSLHCNLIGKVSQFINKEPLTVDSLRIGYVVWDWPAMSQTFVINEVRWLVEKGFDVKVYYYTDPERAYNIDFDVDQYLVSDVDHLVNLIIEHQRTALHSPFAYPATTLLTWPAAEKVNIPFTFMPGGVDISHFENRKRNRVGEVARSECCVGVITLGSYHRDLLLSSGVPSNKIIMERQAVGLPQFLPCEWSGSGPIKIVSVGRFVEKKGFRYLIEAAQLLPNASITIYGYGPEEQALKELVLQIGASNVSIEPGPSTTNALHAIYHAADLFVLPCVEATNGDMDGLPTVLLEAMAAGVPVLSSRIANIPDLITDGVTGYLAMPNDSADLVEAVGRFRRISKARHQRLLQDANEKARSYASVERTVKAITDSLSGRSIDIFMVTYDNSKYRNVDDTVAIINRVYKYTTMKFKLTIVDNGSDELFRSKIRQSFCDRENFRFVELDENIFCGPASNIALQGTVSEYAIYICSKEGFVLKHGWEREIVRAMDEQPTAAMGGHLLPLAKYSTGEQLLTYPSFEHWRNKSYAQQNSEGVFAHIQGGLYVLRMQVFHEIGGFNSLVPQDGMDVEYSYYIVSCGYHLLDIPTVAAVSNKTLPRYSSFFDENTLAVHPSSHSDIIEFDEVSAGNKRFCVCCGTRFSEFICRSSDDSLCPNCQSTGFGRTVWRSLSYSGFLQSRPDALVISDDSGLLASLGGICRNVEAVPLSKALEKLTTLGVQCDRPQLVIVDGDEQQAEIIERSIHLSALGVNVFLRLPFIDDEAYADTVIDENTVRITKVKFISSVGDFDWAVVANIRLGLFSEPIGALH